MNILAQKAIQAALTKNWKKAEELNLKILAQETDDISSLNRLGLAQANLGKTKLARKTFRLVLNLDPANPIALKNLKRLKTLEKVRTGPKSDSPSLTGNIFLTEKGKTKIVSLVKPAGPQVLSALSVGDQLELDPKKNGIQAKKEKVYLGSLPSSLAFHLQKFLEKGYRYQVFFCRSDEKTISVFIREVFRPKKMSGVPSFI